MIYKRDTDRAESRRSYILELCCGSRYLGTPRLRVEAALRRANLGFYRLWGGKIMKPRRSHSRGPALLP